MKFIIYMFSFAAGVGTQFSLINISGNFTFIDLLILLVFSFSLIMNKSVSYTYQAKVLGLFLIGFAFWQLISILFSQWIYLGQLGIVLRSMYYTMIVFIGISTIRKSSDLKKIIIFFTLGILVNLINVYVSWNINPRHWNNMILLDNEYINRNTTYYLLVFSIPIAVYLMQGLSKKIYRVLSLVLLLFIIVTNIFTQSKGAWLALAIILPVILFLNLLKITHKKVLKYTASLIIIILMMVLVYSYNIGGVNTEVSNYFDSRLGSYSADEDLRLDYKIVGIKIGLNNLITGVGVKNFHNAVLSYGSHLSTSDPHDVYVGIFSETGTIGFAIYLIILFYPLYYLMKLYSKTKENDELRIHWNTAFALFIAILILNPFTGMTFTDKFFYFFLIYTFGLVNASINLESKESKL